MLTHQATIETSFAPKGTARLEPFAQTTRQRDLEAEFFLAPSLTISHTFHRLSLPEQTLLENRNCWDTVQHRLGPDSICDYLYEDEIGDRPNMPGFFQLSAKELVQELEAAIPDEDWITFDESDQATPWCQEQKDLIYMAMALLQRDEVWAMIEVTVCMLVGAVPLGKVTSTYQDEVKEKLYARINPVVQVLETTVLLTGSEAGERLSATPPLLLKKQASILSHEVAEDEVADGYHIHKSWGALVVGENEVVLSNRVDKTLRKATVLFVDGAKNDILGLRQNRAKACAVIAVARLLFHEFLHMACVVPVPESPKDDPEVPGCASEHTINAADAQQTCDTINMASLVFSYFLDQLVSGGPDAPKWSLISECGSMPIDQQGLYTDQAGEIGKIALVIAPTAMTEKGEIKFSRDPCDPDGEFRNIDRAGEDLQDSPGFDPPIDGPFPEPSPFIMPDLDEEDDRTKLEILDEEPVLIP